ncbi:MAG: AmmeMemoRadiSam system radical SAM enzyme [Anaerolineae bacterium]|nr:AmmeMemoRadiSam system radical SAM enzyme [Anaerolineae bacterium]
MNALQETLDALTAPGELVEPQPDSTVRCVACAHRCLIKPGRRGICQVRFNRGGELRVPRGYVAALQIDPIEKKPFSHVFPGSDALTFGMLGCDFHCAYCQNWLTSQALRDPAAADSPGYVRPISAAGLVELAIRAGCSTIVSSYNEPLITAEWSVEVFRLARERGLRCAFVSNGNATPEALAYLRPWLDAYKVDLKSMQDRNYRKLGGVLENVLTTIRSAHALGLWVEVVTLVVPGFNDSPEELWDAARFLASVSRDIPWHVTAYHPDYKMDNPATPRAALMQAAEIGQEAGLHYVYAGNLPGRVGSLEDTLCPHCAAVLIERRGYVIQRYNLTAQGACPSCGQPVAGLWPADPAGVRLDGPGFPLRI